MTVVSYRIGRPRPAASRGGDCRAVDVPRGLDVRGPHVFSSPPHCRITNGMLRITVGVAGAAPAVTVEAWRGRVVVGDIYTAEYDAIYGGHMSTPAWFSLGTVTVDSPSVAAVLQAVKLVRVTPEVVTIRLVVPLVADAFLSLRRGEPMCRVQHGATRPPLLEVVRRVRWTATPSPTGVAYPGRVEESPPRLEAAPRFLASAGPADANAGAFSLTTSAAVRSNTFGLGMGTRRRLGGPAALHSQLADATEPEIVVEI